MFGADFDPRRRRPSCASQASNASPAEEPSSATDRTAIGAGFWASATPASRKNSLAPQSATMPAMASGVEDGAIGATATPARKPPRNTAA